MKNNAVRKADTIAFIHGAWILLGILCLPLMFIFSWWHIITFWFVGTMVFSWIVFRGCWFLQLEKRWRDQEGLKSPIGERAFIQYYLNTYLGWNYSKTVVRVVNYLYVAILLYVAWSQG